MATKTNDDVPQFFRLSVEVANLEEAISFYSKLLGVQGRKQPGARCYFECGPVTLSVLDVSASGSPHTAAKALYFTVRIWKRHSNARRSWGACRRSRYTTRPAEESWSGRGASDRSMRSIR